jgi:predicted CoA-binding protein
MHSLPVTPINPTTPTIKLSSNQTASYATIPSVSQLPDPSTTALSFLTPPSVTAKVLAEAQKAGVKSVWLQPGSFDDKILEDAKKVFENVVGGFEEGTVGGEGWCVLVDGENTLDDIGRSWKQQRL